MSNMREILVEKVIRVAVNDTIGEIANSIQDKVFSEDEVKEYLDFSREDWYDTIYSQVVKVEIISLDGSINSFKGIPVKKDIRFLGKERLMEMISTNKYVNENIDCIYAMIEEIYKISK